MAGEGGRVDTPADVAYISWASMEAPSMRITFAAIGDLIGNGNFNLVPILIGVATVVLFFWSGKMLREENHKSAVKLGKVEAGD